MREMKFVNDIYDRQDFFQAYAQMTRSREGLAGAGEWHQLRPLFPEVEGKTVLDLGCGYGWHCKYAADRGAASVLGIDLSQRMIDEARRRNSDPKIDYQVCGLEDFFYPADRYDLVISNLVLHYIEDLNLIYQKVYQTLKTGGIFLFNIEHPVFTGSINEDWIYDDQGQPAYWPVDRYFYPGKRITRFLGHQVEKQHHTLTQILMGLLCGGFRIDAVEEAMPPEEMMDIPGMADEMRRPMMLLVKAVKEKQEENR